MIAVLQPAAFPGSSQPTSRDVAGSRRRLMPQEVVRVATATDGLDAMQQARRRRPDLLVLDVMMPGMDGFDMVRKLRGEGLQMPVLFLTARDATADRVTGLTLGGDDYVTKPFSLEEVIARIRAILRRSGSRTEAASAQLCFADIELDDDTHEVRKGGELVE